MESDDSERHDPISVHAVPVVYVRKSDAHRTISQQLHIRGGVMTSFKVVVDFSGKQFVA